MTEQDVNVRYKQQRLLLLRHASKCKHDKCPVTEHCAKIKTLWSHLMKCKNQQCSVKHCMSSRYILSHYRKCSDESCRICGPVRKAIEMSRENKRSAAAAAQLESNVHGAGDAAPAGFERSQPLAKKRRAVHATTSIVSDVRTTTPSERAVAVVSPQRRNSNNLLGDTVLDPSLKSLCLNLLIRLKTHENGWVFSHPVDPVILQIPDYFVVIKKPMDLGTVHGKLESDTYRTLQEFESDVHLTFDNAMTYNPKGSVVYDMAKELKDIFVRDSKKQIIQV